MTKFIKAFRTTENEVCAMYSQNFQEFVIFWNNIHPATGVTSDYDLQIKCLANNENLVEKVENAISLGESDDNKDLDLYLFIRDTFDKLDKVDLQILRTLQENARLTTKELAARVSLSSTPVFERLKRLESGGYIKKYIAVLDAEKLNQGFVVFCSVKLRRLNRDIAAEFTRIIQDIPEVTECYNISGSYDYLLKIHAPNMKYYQEFILNVLGTIDSLGSLESTFVMAEVKHQYGIHI